MDKSTDKLRDHVCDKGGGGVQKSEIFMDVIDGSPLTQREEYNLYNGNEIVHVRRITFQCHSDEPTSCGVKLKINEDVFSPAVKLLDLPELHSS